MAAVAYPIPEALSGLNVAASTVAAAPRAGAAEPPPDAVLRAEQQVWNLYARQDIAGRLGAAKVKDVCRLAAGYAAQVLLATEGAVMREKAEPFAIWLSAMWLINIVFDENRGAILEEDIAVVQDAMRGKLEPTDNSNRFFLRELATALCAAFKEFRRRVAPFRTLAPGVLERLERWAHASVGTLCDDREDVALGAYADWRLSGSAVMCVVCLVALFSCTRSALGLLDSEAALWRRTALAVAYYNDILSLGRDWRRRTPNLVVAIQRHDTGRSMWGAQAEAVGLVDELITKVKADLAGACTRLRAGRTGHAGLVARWCAGILAGSVAWHAREPRYRGGVGMLRALLDGDTQRYSALYSAERAPPAQ